MIYKIHSVIDEKTIYARIDDDGVCRLTCTENDQAFLKYQAEGGKVYGADEEIPAEEQQ